MGVPDQPTPLRRPDQSTPVAVASGGRSALASTVTPTDTPTFTAQQWEQFKHDLTLTPTFTAKELEQYKQDLMQRDADRQATARANGKPPRRLSELPRDPYPLPTPVLGFFPCGDFYSDKITMATCGVFQQPTRFVTVIAGADTHEERQGQGLVIVITHTLDMENRYRLILEPPQPLGAVRLLNVVGDVIFLETVADHRAATVNLATEQWELAPPVSTPTP